MCGCACSIRLRLGRLLGAGRTGRAARIERDSPARRVERVGKFLVMKLVRGMVAVHFRLDG